MSKDFISKVLRYLVIHTLTVSESPLRYVHSREGILGTQNCRTGTSGQTDDDGKGLKTVHPGKRDVSRVAHPITKPSRRTGSRGTIPRLERI